MAYKPGSALAATASRKLMVWVLGLGCALAAAGAAHALPIAFSVQSDGDDNLYSIDLATGAATLIGAVGFEDVEGLSFQPGTGVLFGVDDRTNGLITINTTTGEGTEVGALGVDVLDPGLTFDAAGNLFLADPEEELLYSVNATSGAATEIDDLDEEIVSLAFRISTGVLFGLDEVGGLFTINTTTAAATLVGDVGAVHSGADDAIEFDPATDILYGIGKGSNNIYTINLTTGAGTLAATLTGCTDCSTDGDFESLTIKGAAPAAVPAPGTLALFGLGSLALGLARWLRARR